MVTMSDDYAVHIGAGLPDTGDDRRWHEVSGGGLPWPVRLRLDTDTDGRLVCTGLIVVADEVTSSALRTVRLSAIVEGVFQGILESDDDLERGLVGEALLAPAEQQSRPRTRPGPAGHPDAVYEDFARLYRRALAETPRRPIQTVAKQLNISPATAHRWKATAEAKGILSQSTKGQSS